MANDSIEGKSPDSLWYFGKDGDFLKSCEKMVSTPQGDFAVLNRGDLARLLRLAKERHEFWGRLHAMKLMLNEHFMDNPE